MYWGLTSLVEAEPAPLGSTSLQKGQVLEHTTSFPRIILLANHPRAGSNNKGEVVSFGPELHDNLMSNLRYDQILNGATKPEGERGTIPTKQGTGRGPGVPARAGPPSPAAHPGKALPGHEALG